MKKESWETKAFELVNKYDVANKILNTNITISPKHLKTIFKTIRQGVETMNPIDDEEKEKIRTQAKKEVFVLIMKEIQSGKFRDLVDLYKKCERTIEDSPTKEHNSRTRIKINKIKDSDLYYIQTIEEGVVTNGSVITSEHLAFIKKTKEGV